jgi:hypothetical protein
MNSVLLSLGSGVVSGLVATFLAVVARKYWVSVVMPWYEERIYRNAKIEGRWNSRVSYSKSGHDWDEFMFDIQRHSHSVKATLICTDGANKGSVYNFEGTFRNLILTGTYSTTEQSRLARGTLTLMLLNNGDVMDGSAAVYSPTKHGVFNAQVHATRGEAIAEVRA